MCSSDLAGATGGPAGAPAPIAADPDAAMAAAIEAMRARNVTPAADAAELLALFAIADSLLVIADGLDRAAAALAVDSPPAVRESA